MTRPRLQLHLSTLLIITPLAAGLVWLNVRAEPRSGEGWQVDNPEGSYENFWVKVSAYGWPRTYLVSHVTQSDHNTNLQQGPPDPWNGWAIACDLAICLALLALATVAIEWLTRQAKRRTAS